VNFYLGVIVITALHAAMGVGAEVHQRRTGTLCLAHGALAGTAAYIYAILGVEYLAAPFAALLAVCISTGMGALLALPARRLGPLQYALITFAVQALWSATVLTWRGLTGGALGIAGVPPLVRSSLISSLHLHVALSCILVIVAVRLLRWSERHPLSTAFAALTRSEELASAIGIPARTLRLFAGSLHGAIVGAAGVLFASYLSFIDPTIFSTDLSVIVLACSLVGRPRAVWGPLVGSFVLVAVPDLLRLVGLNASAAAHMRLTLGGAFLTLIATRSHLFAQAEHP